jgi:hypothetical protein
MTANDSQDITPAGIARLRGLTEQPFPRAVF